MDGSSAGCSSDLAGLVGVVLLRPVLLLGGRVVDGDGSDAADGDRCAGRSVPGAQRCAARNPGEVGVLTIAADVRVRHVLVQRIPGGFVHADERAHRLPARDHASDRRAVAGTRRLRSRRIASTRPRLLSPLPSGIGRVPDTIFLTRSILADMLLSYTVEDLMNGVPSIRTRQKFREHLVGTTLRYIDDVFEAAGISRGQPDREVPGQRRSLVEEYYGGVNWRSPSDVQKVLAAFSHVLADTAPGPAHDELVGT